MPTVSVIIPCYNQGVYLPEAVESVLSQSFADFEIVIVNDGSTDAATVSCCNSYDDPRIKVLNTTNQGLASARNNGIESASGTYILPLDADDKIGPAYLADAVEVLEKQPEIGIVYCKARLFGAVEGDWHLPPYQLEEMLRDNVIFCTALFRKQDWRKAGGYDQGMVHGWEDYDLWLSLIESGLQVHRLDGTHFFYRVASDSMVRSSAREKKVAMFKRIYQRHQKLFSDHIESWIEPLLDIREAYLTSRLYVDCGEGLSDASSLARKVEPGRRTISFGLDAFTQIRALRFDPADQPVVVELIGVELATESGLHALDLQNIESNAIICEKNRYMFATEDPQLFLTADEQTLQSTRELRVSADLIAYGSEALKQIVETQRLQIEASKRPSSLLKWLGSRQ